jgi:conjugal transfer pilus assembly protein TraE
MLWDKYKFKLDKFIFENWTFRITTLILSGVIIFEGYLIANKIDNQKVIVLPPKVTKPFWVSGNLVSKSYLEQMGQFIAFFLFDVTKDTAKISVENILPYVEPQYYGLVRKMLYKQIKYIIDNDISRVFYPSAVDVKNKGLIRVIGILKDMIEDNVVSQKQVELDIRYKIKHGRFWITSIVVKENNND